MRGKPVVRNGRHVGVGIAEAVGSAKDAAKTLFQRAGIHSRLANFNSVPLVVEYHRPASVAEAVELFSDQTT